MIVPNLMVSDIAASLAFYRDVLGMQVTMLIDANQTVVEETKGSDLVFAILKWNDAELMLQTVASMAEDVPTMSAEQAPTPGGTIYFRGMDPEEVATRAGSAIVRGPVQQWYGMKELYLRDPDGHVLCVGKPDGAPPEV